jgi:hypothetical protein
MKMLFVNEYANIIVIHVFMFALHLPTEVQVTFGIFIHQAV